MNKAIRQASFIAAALAQFVSDKTQRDVLDNGDLPGFVELLGSGFAVEYLSRKNPFVDIKSDGTVKTALENLGLGEGSALPVGVPVPWPSATPPTGWIKCNGAPFSAEEYPDLAKVYPALKLPDLRGEFIRGWDDGRGVDAGRAIMTTQGDAIQNITGEVGFIQYFGETHQFGALFAGGAQNNTNVAPGSGAKAQSIFFDASRSARTSNETRSRNIAFNYIVRAA